VTAVTVAFLLRVYNAARRPDAARVLGILWDLASYWPRAAHPFVPPCYAQKAVPDLVERAQNYIDKGHTVVLSSHSQGSLIVLAVALRMDPARRKRLGLVMAGSQLQWAYPRAFPAVVDVGAYRRVLSDLKGRWYVLARGTDPLGGPVLSWDLRNADGKLTACALTEGRKPEDEQPGRVEPHGPGFWTAGHDWWISDPMPVYPASYGFGLAPFVMKAQRHSGYWSHPQWDQAVARASAPFSGPSPPGHLLRDGPGNALDHPQAAVGQPAGEVRRLYREVLDEGVESERRRRSGQEAGHELGRGLGQVVPLEDGESSALDRDP